MRKKKGLGHGEPGTEKQQGKKEAQAGQEQERCRARFTFCGVHAEGKTDSATSGFEEIIPLSIPVRFAKILFAALCLCVLGERAFAADQTFAAPAGNVLHGVDGKTYWEMFAVCFASANAVLEKAALDQNETAQTEMTALAADVRERGIARLVKDRTVFEGEAEEVFLARAAQFMPAANFADACRLYIKDHDSRFGAPQ